MKLHFHSRAWHRWVSIALALPLLVVAVTAVFMSHKKALGTDEITVAANWLPGYTAKAGRLEARSTLASAGGDLYIGTLNGLYRLSGQTLVAIEELAGTQVRGLTEAPWGKVVAARNGIWVEKGGQDGGWRRVLKGDAWNAAARPDGTVTVVLRDKGLLLSGDGRNWQPDPALAAALAALPTEAEALTLARLVLDLHTGKAFFGKEGEWIWIDLVGLALALLALTGVYMWWWRRNRRQAARKGE